jgi:hypothetical protein
MALGTMTRTAGKSADTSKPVFFDRVAFLGDTSYPEGGTTGFDALITALLGDSREVIGIIPEDCGGYMPVYLPADDGTLKVYRTDQIDDPQEEVPDTTALDGITFNLLVISK